MKFQVEAVNVGGEFVQISSETYNYHNVYTLLVGRNAVGKTRALSKIANAYIFSDRRESSAHDVTESSRSVSQPSQVIAVSNSRFDRFPKPNPYFIRERELKGYHYLGLSGFRSSPSSVISKSIANLISRFEIERDRSVRFDYILDYIGFLPRVNLELRINSALLPQGNGNSRAYLEGAVRRTESGFKYDFEKEILPAVSFFSNGFKASRTLTVRYDFDTGMWGQDGVGEYMHILPVLIESGLFKVFRIHLYDKKTKDKVLLDHASSGQQCMFLMFLGMSSLIKDGSLICIDEPEISLHPKWQSEFIGILQGAFSNYRGCHFIIATHSPQLVAGLTSENGFVADLETSNLLRPEDYAKKSADYQLSEVFHEPGYKNEYLIRILLVILSKVNKGQPLSSLDRSKLRELEYVRDRLDVSDPVLHLLDQVKVMAG